MNKRDLYSVSLERKGFYVDAAYGEEIYKLRVTVKEDSEVRCRFLFIESTDELLMNVLSKEESQKYIGEEFALMQEAFFSGLDNKKMALYFLSKYVGKRNRAERIFWLDSIEGQNLESGTGLLRAALKRLEPRVMRSGGLMVFGEYRQWPEIGKALDACKMRLVEGTIYRIGLKVDREFFGKFGVRYVR